MTTKNPAYALDLVLRLARKKALDDPFGLTKDECEALELVGRYQHHLKRKFP